MTSLKPIIGLVGGIGSGKSAAAAALARRGGFVVAGDPAGHAALKDPAIRAHVAAVWPDAVGDDGEIDRRVLGRIVFADPAKLKELESIVFPWIKNSLRDQIVQASADPSVRFVVLDAAVMLEANWEFECDKIVFVDAPRDVRVARVAERGWSAEDLDRREKSQWTLERKKARSDAILDNSAGLTELQKNADALLAKWKLLNEVTQKRI